MKAFRVCRYRVGAVMILLLLAAVIPGCSKKGTLVLDSSTFSSAPPELKEKWKAAAEYASSRNYLGAATNLIDIFGKTPQLTPEQLDALNQAWLRLGNEAFTEANKGDKAATEAVLKMKATGIGARRGK